MPGLIHSHLVLGRARLRPLASDLAAWFALAGVLIAASCSHRAPAGTVAVDHIPPDACLAFYGPGPCREHGMTVTGSTDAVAGPPPESWRGKVQAQPSREPVR